MPIVALVLLPLVAVFRLTLFDFPLRNRHDALSQVAKFIERSFFALRLWF
jgi:hypothetical protein